MIEKLSENIDIIVALFLLGVIIYIFVIYPTSSPDYHMSCLNTEENNQEFENLPTTTYENLSNPEKKAFRKALGSINGTLVDTRIRGTVLYQNNTYRCLASRAEAGA